MALDSEILSVKVFGELQGQVVLNVFHYQLFTGNNPSVSIGEIALDWGIEFDTKIMTHLCQQLVTNRLLVENLTDVNEFTDGSFVSTGDGGLDPLPVHDTISVKLNRQTKVTRNGRKSFSGLSEADTADGLVALSGPRVDDIESFCGQPLALLNSENADEPYFLNPIIIGRSKNISGVYELDLNKINLVQGASMNPRVRTQNTRKR